MSISTLKHQYLYALRQVFQDFSQQKCSTLFLISVLAMIFTLPSMSFLLWKNAYHFQQNYPLQGEVSLFLKQELAEKEKTAFIDELLKDPDIQTAVYFSPQESLKDLKGFGLEETEKWFDNSQLPPVVMLTLKQHLTDETAITALNNRLHQLKGVEIVQLEQEYWQKITALTQLLGKIFLGCTLLVIFSVLLMITHSIRGEIYWRKKHIEVMQLLGATKAFILRPFLLKGLFYVGLGSALSLMLTYAFLQSLEKNMQILSELFQETLVLHYFTWGEGILFIGIAGLLGYFTAEITTLRYMKALQK